MNQEKFNRRDFLKLAGAGLAVATNAVTEITVANTKLDTLAGTGLLLIDRLRGRRQNTISSVKVTSQTENATSENNYRLPPRFNDQLIYTENAGRWLPLLSANDGPARLYERLSISDPVIKKVLHQHFQELVDNNEMGRPKVGETFKKLYQAIEAELEPSFPKDSAGNDHYLPWQKIRTCLDKTVIALVTAHSPFWTVGQVTNHFAITLRDKQKWPGTDHWLPKFRPQLATVYPAPADACENSLDFQSRCEGTDRIQHMVFHLFIGWMYLKSLENHNPQIASIPYFGSSINLATDIATLAALGPIAKEQQTNNVRVQVLSEIIHLVWEGKESATDGFWETSKKYSLLELIQPSLLARQAIAQMKTGYVSFDCAFDHNANRLGNFAARKLYHVESEKELFEFFDFLSSPGINKQRNQKISPTSQANLEKIVTRAIRPFAQVPPVQYDNETILKSLRDVLDDKK